MREIILASHGALAAGMADTAQMIIGDQPGLRVLSLQPGSHPDALKRQIENWLAETSADEVLILTDLWGGSVNNALLGLTQDPRVHIIAGMNLNLVLSVLLGDHDDVSEKRMAHIMDEAKTGITCRKSIDKQEEEDF